MYVTQITNPHPACRAYAGRLQATHGVPVPKTQYLRSCIVSDIVFCIANDITLERQKMIHQNIWDLTGKAAVFARGFMEHYQDREDDGKPITLRECQEAGAQAVADLGEEISVAYISKLGRELTRSKAVSKVKKGRNYYLVDGEETSQFFADLELYENWGVDLNPDAMGELNQRAEIIEYMRKFRGVVIEAENPLPKSQYSFLMKKFNEGKLKMAFVYADEYVFIHSDRDWGVSHLDEITPIDEEPDRV